GDQANKDGAVVQGGWKLPDADEDGGGEGFEGANGIACAFAAVRASAAFVSGVEQSAQFISLMQVSVHFIEQQNGLLLIDDAEQNRGTHVLGAKGPGDHCGQYIHSG